jgi:hypothetical protein
VNYNNLPIIKSNSSFDMFKEGEMMNWFHISIINLAYLRRTFAQVFLGARYRGAAFVPKARRSDGHHLGWLTNGYLVGGLEHGFYFPN